MSKNNRRRKKSKIIIIAAVCIVIVCAVIVFYPARAAVARHSMTPLETQEVIPGVYAIENQFVNLYLVKSGDAYIAFDAGYDEGATASALASFGIDTGDVSAVFLTHTDYDHVAAVPLFAKAEIYMADSNRVFLEGKIGQLRSKAFSDMKCEFSTLEDGETVTIAGSRIQCIFTPGHTSGSASYVVDGKYLFAGDTMRLIDGKAALFYAVFNMDSNEQKNSIRKLSGIEGIEYVFTMHTGCTADPSTAFSDWAE